MKVLNFNHTGWFIQDVELDEREFSLNYPCVGYVSGVSVYSMDMLDPNFVVDDLPRRFYWMMNGGVIESLKTFRLYYHLQQTTGLADTVMAL